VLIRRICERDDGVMLYLLRLEAEVERRKLCLARAAGKTGVRE
jgi:hypothetical protein